MICFRAQALFLVSSALLLPALSCSKPATRATSASSATETPATPIDPATTASISGVVHFTGPVPAPKKIDMSADSGCKGENQSEAVIADNGRLANVLVYVKDGLAGRNFPAPSEKVTIAQRGCRYVPHVAAAMVGQPVEFLDNDSTLHNIHLTAKNNDEWNQSQMPNQGPSAHTFTAAEIMIPVKCNQHPWMKMYLNVLGNPFFAVTSKDGSFDLKGLPPGTYTIAAVHEKYGEQDMKITVGPKDSKQDVTFDYRP
jgi:plastocyanin